MPTYAKLVSTKDIRFDDRQIDIAALDGDMIASIPIPRDIVVCNGCNMNIAATEEQEGYLVYLSKRELDADQPYDLYCWSCLARCFPKLTIVG